MDKKEIIQETEEKQKDTVQMEEATEETKEETKEETVQEASDEAIRAVEAMKAAAAAQDQARQEVYYTPGVAWRKAVQMLEEEMEKELSRANQTVADVIEKEKNSCRSVVDAEYAQKMDDLKKEQKDALDKQQQEYEEKLDAQKKQYEEQIETKEKEHEAELEKMKTLYAQQLDEVQTAFRDKLAGLRKEIDHYKEQIEVLMLHIDDPFVLQEIQMKQDAAAKE